MLKSLGRAIGLRHPLQSVYSHTRDVQTIVYTTHVEFQIPTWSSKELPKNLVLWRCDNGTLKLLFALEEKNEYVPSTLTKAAPPHSVSCGFQSEVCQDAQCDFATPRHLC